MELFFDWLSIESIDICCQPLRHIINTEKESAYQQQRAWTFGCCVSKFSLLRNL